MERFVLFDLDDTLIDRQQALCAWIGDLCAMLDLDAGIEHWLMELFTPQGRPSHFEQLRERVGLAESVETLWRRYCLGLAELVSCPPAVLAGLDELRAGGWVVGVLTNGPVDAQGEKLRRSRVAEHVDVCCISDDLGVHKPDVAAFAEAVRRCGITLGTGGWMVGDNPVADIGGGRAAGLRTIWVSGGRCWPGPGRQADLVTPDAVTAIGALLAMDAGPPARR